MNKELEAIRLSGQRLRSDLHATNAALCALASVLTPDQQSQLTKALAELSVMTEQSAENIRMPEVIAQLQASQEKLHQALIGSMAMRQAKLQGDQN